MTVLGLLKSGKLRLRRTIDQGEWTGYASWLMGCGDRSVTFIEEYRITNPWSSRKLLPKSQIQTQKEGKPRCWWIVKCGSCCHKRKLSHCETQLSIFEDNEAVIKMIIKGRCPTMRHVSRTHRVAFVFDRINLDSKIQIKFVHTKNQLADMLTKGSFTKDEWDHLLRLLNIMNYSTFSCSHFSHFLPDLPGTRSKRGQEQASNEGSPMAKPKPTSPIEWKARPMSPVFHRSNFQLSARSFAQELSNPENLSEATAGTSCGYTAAKILSSFLKRWNRKTLKTDTNRGSQKETKMEFRNMRITDFQYLTKVFQFTTTKVGHQNRIRVLWDWSNEDQYLDVGTVYVFIDELGDPSLGWTSRKTWKPCSTWISSKFEEVGIG